MHFLLTSYTIVMFLKVLSHFIMKTEKFHEIFQRRVLLLKYFKIFMKFLNTSKWNISSCIPTCRHLSIRTDTLTSWFIMDHGAPDPLIWNLRGSVSVPHTSVQKPVSSSPSRRLMKIKHYIYVCDYMLSCVLVMCKGFDSVTYDNDLTPNIVHAKVVALCSCICILNCSSSRRSVPKLSAYKTLSHK